MESKQLKQQFQTLPMLQTPADLWARAADLGCRKKGVTADSLDLLIATVALHHGAEVVTFDDNFEKIAQASPLAVKLLVRPH